MSILSIFVSISYGNLFLTNKFIAAIISLVERPKLFAGGRRKASSWLLGVFFSEGFI